MKPFTRIVLFVLSLIFFGEIYFLSGRIESLETAPVIYWILAGFATLRLAHNDVDVQAIRAYLSGDWKTLFSLP